MVARRAVKFRGKVRTLLTRSYRRSSPASVSEQRAFSEEVERSAAVSEPCRLDRPDGQTEIAPPKLPCSHQTTEAVSPIVYQAKGSSGKWLRSSGKESPPSDHAASVRKSNFEKSFEKHDLIRQIREHERGRALRRSKNFASKITPRRTLENFSPVLLRQSGRWLRAIRLGLPEEPQPSANADARSSEALAHAAAFESAVRAIRGPSVLRDLFVQVAEWQPSITSIELNSNDVRNAT